MQNSIFKRREICVTTSQKFFENSF